MQSKMDNVNSEKCKAKQADRLGCLHTTKYFCYYGRGLAMSAGANPAIFGPI
jgi:hypothetical protein